MENQWNSTIFLISNMRKDREDTKEGGQRMKSCEMSQRRDDEGHRKELRLWAA